MTDFCRTLDLSSHLTLQSVLPIFTDFCKPDPTESFTRMHRQFPPIFAWHILYIQIILYIIFFVEHSNIKKVGQSESQCLRAFHSEILTDFCQIPLSDFVKITDFCHKLMSGFLIFDRFLHRFLYIFTTKSNKKSNRTHIVQKKSVNRKLSILRDSIQ